MLKDWKQVLKRKDYIEWKSGKTQISLGKTLLGWNLSINRKDYYFPEFSRKKFVNVDENYTTSTFQNKIKALNYAKAYMRSH